MLKIFLHIGINKSVTTAKQRFYESHRTALKSKGLLYPLSGTENQAAHHALMRLLCQAKPNHKAVNKKSALQAALSDEIFQAKPTAVLLSSEYLVTPNDILPIANFFQDFDVDVIVYLRRHDSWWESLYNQSVKSIRSPSWKPGFDSFVEF